VGKARVQAAVETSGMIPLILRWGKETSYLHGGTSKLRPERWPEVREMDKTERSNEVRGHRRKDLRFCREGGKAGEKRNNVYTAS